METHMVIDSHQHFWQLGRFDGPNLDPGTVLYRDFLPEHLKPCLDGVGVQRTVVVQAIHSVDEAHWLLQLAERHAFIAGIVGWVDLDDPRVGETLDELISHPKFKGVRRGLESEPNPAWVVREDVLRGLGELARRGISYDLLVQPEHLRYVPVVAERVPDLRMVVDHIAKPPIKAGAIRDWAADLAEVAKIPSVYCKLSGMITEADWQHWKPADLEPYVHTVLELFGYDRVMFGSDWPVCLLAGSYGQVRDALVEALGSVSQEQYAKIFGRNTQAFYRLGDMRWFPSP